MNILTLVPAYGKTYKSRNAAVTAWHDGADWRIQQLGMTDQYCSNRDVETLRTMGFTHFMLCLDGTGYKNTIVRG